MNYKHYFLNGYSKSTRPVIWVVLTRTNFQQESRYSSDIVTLKAMRYKFYDWSPVEKPNHSIVRLVTSWLKPKKSVQQFIDDLHHIH